MLIKEKVRLEKRKRKKEIGSFVEDVVESSTSGTTDNITKGKENTKTEIGARGEEKKLNQNDQNHIGKEVEGLTI